MTDEELKVVEKMSRFGGGFVKSLAECFFKADPENFQKLKETFPDYWEDYNKKF